MEMSGDDQIMAYIIFYNGPLYSTFKTDGYNFSNHANSFKTNLVVMNNLLITSQNVRPNFVLVYDARVMNGGGGSILLTPAVAKYEYYNRLCGYS